VKAKNKQQLHTIFLSGFFVSQAEKEKTTQNPLLIKVHALKRTPECELYLPSLLHISLVILEKASCCFPVVPI